MAPDPHDALDALLARCRAAARARKLPADLDPARALPGLAQLLRTRPEERGVTFVFIGLHRLELVHTGTRPAPDWWSRRKRTRLDQGHLFCARSGLPLTLHRPLDGARMALVPEGDSIRGTDAGEEAEGPPHLVTLDSFYIDVRPVTVTQYRLFLKAVGRPLPPFWDRQQSTPQEPVRTSWAEATEYAAWVGGRLPTEAELEKALRGTDGWRFPWGDRDLSPDEPGARRLVSPFGLRDVRRPFLYFCDDYYDPQAYARAPRHNPRVRAPPADEAPRRVVRPGSPPGPEGGPSIPCTARGSVLEDTLDPELGFDAGFRVAFSAAAPGARFPEPGTEPAPRLKRKPAEGG